MSFKSASASFTPTFTSASRNLLFLALLLLQFSNGARAHCWFRHHDDDFDDNFDNDDDDDNDNGISDHTCEIISIVSFAVGGAILLGVVIFLIVWGPKYRRRRMERRQAMAMAAPAVYVYPPNSGFNNAAAFGTPYHPYPQADLPMNKSNTFDSNSTEDFGAPTVTKESAKLLV